MNCNCRTEIPKVNPERFKDEVCAMNADSTYYFILIDKNAIILERASLVQGNGEDISKEKVELMERIRKL